MYLAIMLGLSVPTFYLEAAAGNVANNNSVDHSTDEEKKVAIAVEAFIKQMIEQEGFTQQELQPWFSTAKVNQSVLKKISRPAESVMTWQRYRNIFIQQERIDKGVIFWKQHAETLSRAEKKFGVPAELIVGLIGVETKYGRIKGRDDVFNALYTLGFHYPRRSHFFKKELKEFLKLAKEQQWTVGTIQGSYAGAMGYGQFMPSSYRMYAVDFDGDGKIDLLSNPVDAIGSVASYIQRHGWKTGEDIIHKVEVAGTDHKQFLDRKLKPSKTIAELIKGGVKVSGELDRDQKAILIELPRQDVINYWLGLHNFYVISRYNPRTFYTMAVTQLTHLIKAKHQAEATGTDL